MIIISGFGCRIYKPDAEHERIIKKLQKYGIKTSGSKTLDKEKLHEIELREAQKETSVTSKFLTVSSNEQEEIQEKKKEKRTENAQGVYQEAMKGQELLGQQIMIAIDMKRKKES